MTQQKLDREKVIKAIENCIGQPKCKDCPWEACELEHEVVNNVPYGLMRDALALLKEREPVEPICWANVEWPIYKCGNCGVILEFKQSYCHDCGRAVKWDA